MKCLNCSKEHDSSFGSGLYCSRICANTRIHSIETKEKIKNSLLAKKIVKTQLFTHTCIKCTSVFEAKNFRKGRKVLCHKCKRKNNTAKNPTLLLDFGLKTVSNYLKNKDCSLCGWNKSTLDIHHILPKCEGGSDDYNNLILICPNCHRLCHDNFYSKEKLFNHSIFNLYKNIPKTRSGKLKP